MAATCRVCVCVCVCFRCAPGPPLTLSPRAKPHTHWLADIATAGKDSDFEPAREEVRRMLAELNLTRVRQVVDQAAGVGLAGRL